MTQKPIPESYWVLPEALLAGEYPRTFNDAESQVKIKALIDAGVKAFIDLTEVTDPLKPYAHLLHPYAVDGVTHERFAIRDMSVPKSHEHAAAILDAIDAHLSKKRTVYVHCWGGIGRTGTIIGCWLSRHGYEGAAALSRLDEVWQQCAKSADWSSPQTPAQIRFVKEWKE